MNRLRLDELEELNCELQKEAGHEGGRNVQKIEELVVKLRAFKSLNPALRRMVLERATYKRYGQNEVLYRQGEEGHFYYFMIRGSVSLLSNRSDFGNFDLYLRSYYDGDVFGEQPQLFANKHAGGEQQVASEEQLRKLSLRDSTCIANEECYVLEVSNLVKHDFYKNDSSNQYDMCLYWLRKNPTFKTTEGFYLL